MKVLFIFLRAWFAEMDMQVRFLHEMWVYDGDEGLSLIQCSPIILIFSDENGSVIQSVANSVATYYLPLFVYQYISCRRS